MPAEVRCGRCGYVFWRGSLEELFQLKGSMPIVGMRRVAEMFLEEHGKCPKCGKLLEIPSTVEVESLKKVTAQMSEEKE